MSMTAYANAPRCSAQPGYFYSRWPGCSPRPARRPRPLTKAAVGIYRVPQDVTIPGAPLSVVVRDTSSYGVYRNGVQQFYGGNAKGVYLWVNGQVWGPEAVPQATPSTRIPR